MGVKDGIEHIDTNIIIRLITQDDPKLARRAEKLISNKNKLFVFEDAAMMEVIFVLAGEQYNLNRHEIAESIIVIMETENLICNKGLIEDALNLYVAHPKLSFVDCYLSAAATISQETPLWTLDHKLAAQSPVAKLL